MEILNTKNQYIYRTAIKIIHCWPIYDFWLPFGISKHVCHGIICPYLTYTSIYPFWYLQIGVASSSLCSAGHYIVCLSCTKTFSLYGGYLKTFFSSSSHFRLAIVVYVLIWLTHSNCPCGIFRCVLTSYTQDVANNCI